MNELSVQAVAEIVGGRVIGDPNRQVGPGVVIDSRIAQPGSLFVALPGEKVDGHDYLVNAADRGAAAALVGHPVATALPQIVVPDPLLGLAALARAVVTGLPNLHTLAVTGSSGKTSTKDLLAAILGEIGPTVAPIGSFNNEIGVPLTATEADSDTRFLVSEFGARGPGHIRYLCQIVPPEVGIVLNVGNAHLGEFGSIEATEQAKGELVEALPHDGWAVLNADDPRVLAMADRTGAAIATWSTRARPVSGQLVVWAESALGDDRQRFSFELCGDEFRVPVRLSVSGAHQVANALAAASAALVLGVPPETIAGALGRATASHWRMELQERADGLLVVNDSYNANPDSMRAALQSVSAMRRQGGRVIGLLGDMLELGQGASEAHLGVGRFAAQTGVDLVIAVGDYAAQLADGARRGGAEAVVVTDREAALTLLRKECHADDVVLVKASRGIALETVAVALATDCETREDEV